MGIIRLLLLIEHIDLMSVYFGEDQRIKIVKTHVWKEIEITFSDFIDCSTLNGEHNWEDPPMYSLNDQHALPIMTTKSGEVRTSTQLLLLLHRNTGFVVFIQWVGVGEDEKRTESHPHILQHWREPYIKCIVYHV